MQKNQPTQAQMNELSDIVFNHDFDNCKLSGSDGMHSGFDSELLRREMSSVRDSLENLVAFDMPPLDHMIQDFNNRL